MNDAPARPASATHRIPGGGPGGWLFVRERRPVRAPRGAVLFVHGATIASSLFDVPFGGLSMLDAFAARGYLACALDLRGYGRSVRGAGVRCSGEEAVQDVGTVLDWIGACQPALPRFVVGGSWGSIVAARTAIRRTDLRALVLLSPIHATRNPGWLDDLADPVDRARLRELPASRWVTTADLLRRWDPEIPGPDPARRRDARVVPWLVDDLASVEPSDAESAGDPGGDPVPRRFRAPNGTLADLFVSFSGGALYDPARIRVPTLVIRGSDDATSTRGDALAVFDALGTPDRTLVEIADAGHFVGLERRAPELHRAIAAFLDGPGDAAPVR